MADRPDVRAFAMVAYRLSKVHLTADGFDLTFHIGRSDWRALAQDPTARGQMTFEPNATLLGLRVVVSPSPIPPYLTIDIPHRRQTP